MEIFTRIYDQDLGKYVVLEIEFDVHEVGTGRPSRLDRFEEATCGSVAIIDARAIEVVLENGKTVPGYISELLSYYPDKISEKELEKIVIKFLKESCSDNF